MAGVLHQGILRLFTEDPWLAFDLLGIPRPADCHPIDRRAEAEVPQDLLLVRRGFPDLVLVHDDDSEGIVIAIEAQRKRDKRKRWRLPFIQAVLANDHELPCWMVLVSFSRAMSQDLRAWSEGPPPRVDVLLLDASSVPPIHDIETGRQRPTATVLAAALHGYRGDILAARVGLQSITELPDAKRRWYTATILAAVKKTDRRKLMDLIPLEEQDELLAIEKMSGTYHRGLEDGRK
ncbi:MAG: hypothetical protein KC431_05510, partial [Myxococcales bacterium]|nr:hypothetical protein [Myxococcales bacterium]